MNQTKSQKVKRANLIHNIEEKIIRSKQKHGMIGQADNQTLAPNFAHDFKCAQCESKDMS
jgi:hypothetical protein